MSDGLIPQRYAKALYKFASEHGDITGLYNQIKQVVASFRSNPDMLKVLSNPFVDKDDKERLLLAAAGSAGKDDYSRFVRLILDHRRAEYTYLIMLAFCDLYREQNHIKTVKITTAVDFDDAQMEKIRNVVKHSFPNDSLEYEYIVDEDVIGGFIIDVNSVRMDASISNEIAQLRQNLLRSN